MCPNFVIASLLVLCSNFVIFCNGELKHVFVTVRETEHTPRNYAGGLKIIEHDVPGILTERGKEIAYAAGRFLSETYGPALNCSGIGDLSFGDYSLCSTKDDTCKQTALALGAGLRNSESEMYKNWTRSELDAVYSEVTDQFMRFYYTDQCPAFADALRKRRPDFAAAVKKIPSKSLLAVVIRFTAQTIQDPRKLWLAHLTLESMQKDPDSELPSWANDNVVKDLKDFSRQFFKIAGSTDVLKRLSGGRRLTTIMADIVDLIVSSFGNDHIANSMLDDGVVGEPKMSILVAPQCVLAAQAAAFSTNHTLYRGGCILDNVYPEQGAMHVIELHCDDQTWSVRVLYKPDENESLDVVRIHNEEEFCEVYELVQMLLPYFITEEELDQECMAKL